MAELQEERIVKKLHALSSRINQSSLKKVTLLQLEFLARALLDSNQELQKPLIDVSWQICNIVGFSNSIDEDARYHLPNNGIVVIANHIGLNKLTKISPHMLEEKLIESGMQDVDGPIAPMPNNDPFLFLFAPVICALCNLFSSDKIHIALITMDYPKVYSNIVKRTGGIVVESIGESKYMNMLNSALALSESCKRKNVAPVFIILPEGGTSGKRSNGTPYTLEEFKNGYSRLANNLRIPILPIIVHLDCDSKIATKVLSISHSSPSYDVSIDRKRMQDNLSAIHAS